MTVPSSDTEIVVPLHVEDVSVKRRKVERDVRVHVRTVSHDHLSNRTWLTNGSKLNGLRSTGLWKPFRLFALREITTIISVVEEVLVVERRLVLKEEIRLHRVRTTARHSETVTLREQQAVIERAEPGAGSKVPTS